MHGYVIYKKKKNKKKRCLVQKFATSVLHKDNGIFYEMMNIDINKMLQGFQRTHIAESTSNGSLTMCVVSPRSLFLWHLFEFWGMTRI